MKEHEQLPPAVVALSGRRVDSLNADQPRFPLSNVRSVRERISEVLAGEGADVLVCSAACGADLIALEEAERLGLRRRIILPFAAERFRQSSVVDRPGKWGPTFDRQVAMAHAAGDLVVLDAGDGDAAYAAANETIVREARALANATATPHRLVAVVAWDGAPRGEGDATQGFRQLTVAAGFEQRSVRTL